MMVKIEMINELIIYNEQVNEGWSMVPDEKRSRGDERPKAEKKRRR